MVCHTLLSAASKTIRHGGQKNAVFRNVPALYFECEQLQNTNICSKYINLNHRFSSNSRKKSLADEKRSTNEQKSFTDAVYEEGVKQQKGLTETLSHYVESLRLKAALSLTASLSTTNRETVLQSTGAVDKQTADVEKKHSIGEAVAKAVAEEASRSVLIMKEKERDIIEQTEAAALARIQNEIKIYEQTLQDESPDAESDHPILGPTLFDFGYKRIHVVSASTLSTIPVWERQRTYRHDRAKLMASEKSKALHTGLPGIIALYEGSDGNLSIIDGQHRVGMLTLLKDKYSKEEEDPFDLDNILVEVFPEKDLEVSNLANDVFTEINKAEPVKQVDMPDVVDTHEKGNLEVINSAASSISKKYPEMFKASQNCRMPHVNIDNLRNKLFTSGVIEQHSIRDSNTLLLWIEEKNLELGERYKNSEDENNIPKKGGKKIGKAALTKALKHNFFLGLDSSWVYQ
eukprot:CAMPEP_0194362894 /NCGR_PEP_ID=MMETSP0174-20130528/10748_1 /TAXON_ID=216777 /ORGANISM="Proboscia alata, Strain PI-D3" /LENGTH=459 /DNA_ID=CAMNT_0039136089 /DNA_START=13 /DNA_END=1392 /DNA_ORIENTATION=-